MTTTCPCHAHDVRSGVGYSPDHRCTSLCSHSTPECVTGYKSEAARDAQRTGYGDKSYWNYLDESAQEHYDYFAARGDQETADLMFTQSLSDSLRGNDGD